MTPPLLVVRPGGKPSGGPEVSRFHLEVFPPERWADGAADIFETSINAVIADRGHCVIGLSGGSTPAAVFHQLAKRSISWADLTVVQVDERIAPIDSGDRNLVGLQDAFAGLPVHWLALPVDQLSTDTTQGVDGVIESFLVELETVAGSPPVLDIVHLGLGSDGHTASLVPGDPILENMDHDVALTGTYQGRQRLSLTRPLLDRARLVFWLVTGSGKAAALRMLLDADSSIPASLLNPGQSIVIADSPALAGSSV